MTAEWIPITYRDFYDIPRMFVAQGADGTVLLFDCEFDEQKDDYASTYRIYRLSPAVVIPEHGSWKPIPDQGAFVGEIPVSSVEFDASRRTAINGLVLTHLTI